MLTAILAFCIFAAVIEGPPKLIPIFEKQGDQHPIMHRVPIVSTICWGLMVLVPATMILVLEKGWPQ